MTYSQSTGVLRSNEGRWMGVGYSGNGAALNNPADETIHGHGPIPRGVWTLGAPTEEKGPLTFPLTPSDSTKVFGRSGFLIHGDNSKLNLSASEGCVVLGRSIRNAIALNGDSILEVIS